MPRPVSFRRTLLISFALVALVPVLLVEIFLLISIETQTHDSIIRESNQLAEALRGQISVFLSGQAKVISLVSRLRAGHSDHGTDFLQVFIDNSSEFESIFVANEQGRIIDVAFRREVGALRRDYIGLDVSHRDFFAAVRTKSDVYWSDAHPSFLTGNAALTVSVPFDGGVVSGDFLLGSLDAIIASVRRDTLLDVSIIDRVGVIIYGPTPEQVAQRLNVSDLAIIRRGLRGHSDTLPYVDRRGVTRLGGVTTIPETGWLLYLSRDADQAFAPVYRRRTAFAAVALIVVLLAVGASLLMSARVLRPLAALTDECGRLARGDYRPAAGLETVTDYREFRSLADAFLAMHRNVVDRERALRQSEAHLRKISDLLPVGITITHPESGRFKYGNPAFLDMFGCTQGGLEGLSAMDFYVCAGDRSRILEDIEKRDQIQGQEIRLKHPASAIEKWISLSVCRFEIDGEIWLLSGLVDLTVHKRIELAVIESERRFRAFMDNAPAAMAIKDLEGRYTRTNRAFQDWYLATGESPIGKTSADVLPHVEAERALADDRSVLDNRTATRRERLISQRDGREEEALVIKFPVLSDGNVVEIGIIVIDISEQRRMKAELDRVHRAVEQCRTSIVITNADGEIEYVNPATVDVTGYTVDELTGRNPRLLQSGYTRPEVYKDLWTTLQQRRVWQGEFHNRTKDGRVISVVATISPVHDDRGRLVNYVAVTEDVTERSRVQLELEIAKLRAESANQAKSHFLMIMSHELRTPLNSIIGFSEILKEAAGGMMDWASVREYGGFIYESGSHLLSMIEDILEFSKLEAGRFTLNDEAVDIVDCVRSAVAIVSGRARQAEVAIDYGGTDRSCRATADHRAIRQVLVNLLSNAIKFTPQGGVVRVELDADSDQGIVISVADTGIGMTHEEAEKALLPFVQIDNHINRRYQGTGLGLPLSRSLIRAHGGHLEIESTAGVGTVVRVTLPAERIIA